MASEESEKQLQFSYRFVVLPSLFVFIIWVVYWLEINFNYNFNTLGVYPRTFSGIKGVFLAPFIHSNTSHLLNNSLPLWVLLSSLFYFYKEVAYKVLIFGGICTGVLTWLIARPSFHIGASGIVYLLFSFVFFSGLIRKHYRLVAVSLITIFLYGSMIWYVLPIKDKISWEGHLSGFIVGICLSYAYRKKGIVKDTFEFSKTEFDKHFDEQGNYVPPPIIEEALEENDGISINSDTDKYEERSIVYKYHYKRSNDTD